MKKNKIWTWILAAVYVMLFTVLGTYGYRQICSIENQKKNLSEENRVLAAEKENAIQEKEKAGEQKKDMEGQIAEKENALLKQQEIINGYESILSGLEVYRSQVEGVRSAFASELAYQPSPIAYNYDQAVQEDNAKKGKFYNTLSNILPGVMGFLFSASEEDKNNANTDILAQVNQQAQDILISPRQNVSNQVSRMNVCIDMYNEFVDAESLEEQFVNLQVLEKVCQRKPINNDLLEGDRQKFMECLKDYYVRLKAVYDMYKFVLTDNSYNQAYLSSMEGDLQQMEGIFAARGINPMQDLNEEQMAVLLQIQQTLRGIVDDLESKRAVLPSIPIANQGFLDYKKEGRGARVYHYEKDMESGKMLIYIQERKIVGDGVSQIIYDLNGEPVYVEGAGGHAYYYDGIVLENAMAGDASLAYQKAVNLYQNFYGMSNEDYFANTLLEM